jgi:hypothetical protein
MRNWLIIGGVVIGIYLLSRRRLASNVKVIFRGVNFTGGIKRPTFNLMFGIQNPTNQTAKLESLVGQVEANGKVIADVQSFDVINIGANAETAYKVTAKPQGLNIAQSLLTFIKAKGRGAVKFNFTGTANVDGINIPLSQSATI